MRTYVVATGVASERFRKPDRAVEWPVRVEPAAPLADDDDALARQVPCNLAHLLHMAAPPPRHLRARDLGWTDRGVLAARLEHIQDAKGESLGSVVPIRFVPRP